MRLRLRIHDELLLRVHVAVALSMTPRQILSYLRGVALQWASADSCALIATRARPGILRRASASDEPNVTTAARQS